MGFHVRTGTSPLGDRLIMENRGIGPSRFRSSWLVQNEILCFIGSGLGQNNIKVEASFLNVALPLLVAVGI